MWVYLSWINLFYLFLKAEAALQSNGAVGRVAHLVVDDGWLYLHAEVGTDVEVGQLGVYVSIYDGQQVHPDKCKDA